MGHSFLAGNIFRFALSAASEDTFLSGKMDISREILINMSNKESTNELERAKTR